MSEAVRNLLQQFTAIWWQTATDLAPLPPVYTAREQAAKEEQLDRFLESLIAELQHPPRTEQERRTVQEHLTPGALALGKAALGFEEHHLQAIQSYGFVDAGIEFIRMARHFDPALSDDDIFQASRNAWTMNLLQLLLGLPVRVTPAIFAYSMLYPYSDNYLDDPTIPAETKRDFNERFSRRLAGEPIVPANDHERTICELVGMIEGQFDRSHYPQVFASLLDIHRAQAKSLGLLRPHASPYEVDVLGISFEKGGTSVLADGCLVTGSLDDIGREFMFAYGAFTQLLDDLEDVQQDLRDGRLTVFSQTARHWPLDAVTNRTFRFGSEVLRRLDLFPVAGLEPLKELMARGIDPILIDAAGSNGRFYTRRYLRELQSHMPFRFAFLRKQRRRLAAQHVSLVSLVEAFAPAGAAGA